MSKSIFFILNFISILLSNCPSLIAQENNHWQLGSNGLGIHFGNDNIPYASLDGYTPYGWAGCGVLNNQFAGNLVFYTDGQKVIDRTHQIMPNGSDLYGANSTHGTGKICSRIGYPGQYYVFSIATATESSSIESLYYSIADTTLAGNGTVEEPFGDVLEDSKNIWLSSDVSESLEIIKGEEDQIWLLSPRYYEPVIDIFLIDEAGINLTSSVDYGVSMIDVQAIRYSPSSQKLALGSFGENDPVLIFDFNNITGTLSSPVEVPGSFGTSSNQYSGIIDLEWSPDGSKLYLSKYRGNMPLSGGKLFQYDLDNPDDDAILIHQISATNTHVAKGLRLGPDGSIYWMYVDPETGNSNYIAAILNPNEAGVACNLNLEYLFTNTNLNYTNLFPNAAIEFKDQSTVPVQKTAPKSFLLNLYPQPAKEEITVSLASYLTETEFWVEIIDSRGKAVYKEKINCFNNQFTLDVRNFANGIYNLQVHSKKMIVAGKFIKN